MEPVKPKSDSGWQLNNDRVCVPARVSFRQVSYRSAAPTGGKYEGREGVICTSKKSSGTASFRATLQVHLWRQFSFYNSRGGCYNNF